MRRLIAQVRLDFKTQNLQWFISEQHPAAIWKNVADINGALRTLARTEAGVFMVPTSHLPYERTHFGTQGTLCSARSTQKHIRSSVAKIGLDPEPRA